MKKIIPILIVLVIVILLGVFFVTRQSDNISEIQKPEVKTEVKKINNAGFLPENKKLDKFKDDQDRDGILDVEEEALGLSTRNFDTDGDGISDKSEIDKWGTDPTKADTDGDGYWDFFEIMNGYNPLGEGKL